MDAKKELSQQNLTYTVTSSAILAGIIYAVYKKENTAKTIGYAIGAGAIGLVLSTVINNIND